MACHLALGPLLHIHSDCKCSIVLERPKGCIHATLGARSFSIAAPTVWNSFPMHICDIESLGPFERHVKTYLFRLTFALF